MSASSMKTIKNRIKSIQGTMQITKAMELVAASKMRKASERIEGCKLYFKLLHETMEDIAGDNKDFSSVFTREREGRACHVVIAGDRGLAGGYNHNLLRSVKIEKNDIIFPIGVKAHEYFSDYDIYSDSFLRAGDVNIDDCRKIGNILAKGYEKGDFTHLTLNYTKFMNMIAQRPESVDILPVKSEKSSDNRRGLIVYEPDAESVFERIIPHYISGMIYGAVCNSVVSELSARRNAMESASDNASQMLDKLSLEYNRARQASITQELTEITAGAGNLR